MAAAAASSTAASKLLHMRNSALPTLIRRLHISPSAAAAAKYLLPSIPNRLLHSFLPRNGVVRSDRNSSNAYSLLRIEAARTYATMDGHNYEDTDEDDDDEDYDDDDLENYSGSEFDDEDEYEDPDEDPDAK